MTTSGDRVFEELLRLIAEHGWAVRHVGADAESSAAAFSYTVGLTALHHPEVVITGMPFEQAQIFLNNIAADVGAGLRFHPGLITDDFTSADAPVVFLAVQDSSGLTAVRQVYGRVQAVQMVWPDSAGCLPWQEGYRNPPEAQPLLGDRPSA